MPRISVSRDIDQPPGRVWAAVADLGSHVEWMKDARSIEFISDRRRGVGTRMNVETRVGPLRTLDVIEVTGWVEGSTIEVVHRGIVTGEGALSVRSSDGHARVSWVEELRFPWWLGGPLTAWLARPILAAVWRGNLRRLEESLTSP